MKERASSCVRARMSRHCIYLLTYSRLTHVLPRCLPTPTEEADGGGAGVLSPGGECPLGRRLERVTALVPLLLTGVRLHPPGRTDKNLCRCFAFGAEFALFRLRVKRTSSPHSQPRALRHTLLTNIMSLWIRAPRN